MFFTRKCNNCGERFPVYAVDRNYVVSFEKGCFDGGLRISVLTYWRCSDKCSLGPDAITLLDSFREKVENL